MKLTVTLAYSAEEDITLVPELTGDAEYLNAFEISTEAVLIKKGQKTADFYLRAQDNKVISKAGNITVSFKAVSSLNSGEAVSVSVAPKFEVELTAEQLQLVEAWQETYGIDVRQFIGALQTESIITFNDDDNGLYFDESPLTLKNVCPITLSDKADKENIVLRMEGDALGLRDFLYNMLKKQSVEDTDNWLANSHNEDLLKAINYNKETEEFTVSLDITINPEDQTIAFTGDVEDQYGETITNIPFEFNYTAWNRQKEMAENGATFILDNGDEADEEITMADAIDWGITLNPVFYLVSSDISYDAWESEPSLWVEPTAKYDDTQMTFTFPWDFMNASGYEKIEVKITLNK